MEKLAPNSKFVRHFTEIIQKSKIKGPLLTAIFQGLPFVRPQIARLPFARPYYICEIVDHPCGTTKSMEKNLWPSLPLNCASLELHSVRFHCNSLLVGHTYQSPVSKP